MDDDYKKIAHMIIEHLSGKKLYKAYSFLITIFKPKE